MLYHGIRLFPQLVCASSPSLACIAKAPIVTRIPVTDDAGTLLGFDLAPTEGLAFLVVAYLTLRLLLHPLDA